MGLSLFIFELVILNFRVWALSILSLISMQYNIELDIKVFIVLTTMMTGKTTTYEKIWHMFLFFLFCPIVVRLRIWATLNRRLDFYSFYCFTSEARNFNWKNCSRKWIFQRSAGYCWDIKRLSHLLKWPKTRMQVFLPHPEQSRR